MWVKESEVTVGLGADEICMFGTLFSAAPSVILQLILYCHFYILLIKNSQ